MSQRATDAELEKYRVEGYFLRERAFSAAKADQARLLEASGGKPAVIARGDLGFSVPPGVEPDFT